MSSYTIYKEWQNQPVLTTIGTTGLPIEKIKFPAITICGQGSSKDILNNAMFRQLGTYLASQGKNISEMSEEEVSSRFNILVYALAIQIILGVFITILTRATHYSDRRSGTRISK